MNSRNIFALVIVSLAVVVSFLLNRSGVDDEASDQTDLSDGYYLKGLSLTGTDGMGAIQYTLRAERADHDPSDGSIELADLALDYGPADAPWTMSANYGRMPKTSSEISLSGTVKIRNDRLNEESTTISSDTLHVDIENQTASSSDPVEILVGRGRLQGVGLEVDFANEQVNILSDIRGVFDPPEQ